MEKQDVIKQYNDQHKEDFVSTKTILSLEEFLDVVAEKPQFHARSTSEYLVDMFDYFSRKGKKENSLFNGQILSDVFVVGQEEVESRIYRILKNFSHSGEANRLILLHGPNGSSKSSLAEALFRGMESYSQQDEGALYRFNWIFPNERVMTDAVSTQNEPIGFGGSGRGGQLDSFAHLEDFQIACKLICELRDNPLFLFPEGIRTGFFQDLLKGKRIKKKVMKNFLNQIAGGSLCKKCQQIFQNLITVYKGDLVKVFKHIQVERYTYSKKYRVGLATVEPQMHIDANERQITMDNNFQNLPSVLQNLRFFEPAGDLIDANRGVIEYSDLLKRPVETYKYLLTTVEKGTVKLPNSLVYSDVIMIGSTNEKHLDAFKQSPDFASFKGRIELITVPYLLEYHKEQDIYQDDVKAVSLRKHVTPHSVELLCLWAVLTRLFKPNPDSFPQKIRYIIRKLTPIDKAKIYDLNDVPSYFNEKEQEEFRPFIKDLRLETVGTVAYEGRFGASARELKLIIQHASQNSEHACLNFLSIMEELKWLVKDKSVYEFLQIEARDQYHRPADFIKTVEKEFLEIFERELYQAMDLIQEDKQSDLFKKYVSHVTAFIKKEKVFSSISKNYEDPDEQFMQDIESKIGKTGNKTEFRNAILSKIGAFKIDHPNEEVVLEQVLKVHYDSLSHNFYKSKRVLINQVYSDMLLLGTDNESILTKERIERSKLVFSNMCKEFGYCNECVKVSLAHLVQALEKEVKK